MADSSRLTGTVLNVVDKCLDMKAMKLDFQKLYLKASAKVKHLISKSFLLGFNLNDVKAKQFC